MSLLMSVPPFLLVGAVKLNAMNGCHCDLQFISQGFVLDCLIVLLSVLKGVGHSEQCDVSGFNTLDFRPEHRINHCRFCND
jgi:hypothetical protein